MKARLALFFLCLSLGVTSIAYACGGDSSNGGCASCGQYDSCGDYVNCDRCGTADWSNQYAYESQRSCECDCVDPGWRYNYCISKCTYCEAFGNIGQ